MSALPRARATSAAALLSLACTATALAQPPAAAPPAASAPMTAATAAAPAPTAGRRLAQADYERWRAIQGTTLSRDGRWLAYSLAPQVGDGDLVVRGTRDATEWRVPRGFIGRPQLQPNVDSGFTAPPPQFSVDGRVLAALTYATRADFERARRQKAKEMPRASLAIVSLADGRVTSVPRVKSFAMPREAGGWLAYLLESDSSATRAGAKDSLAGTPEAPPAGAAAAAPGGTPRPISADTGKKEKKREYGSTLVLRNLATGEETRIADVTAFAFADSGRWIGYTVASRTPERDGAYVRALSDGRESALATGRGNYKALAFDRRGRQAAFVSDRDESTAEHPRYALYHARLDRGAPSARRVVAGGAAGADLVLSERALGFVRTGDAVVFGVMPAPLDSIPADSLADKAVFDLWHYQDARLQPQQRIEVQRDRARAYSAIYHVADGRWTRLGSDTLAQTTVSEDGRRALAVASLPYAVSAMWGEGGSDLVLVDGRSGQRTLVAKQVPFGGQLSPAGRFVAWFADGRWWAHDVATGRKTDLTGALKGVRFDQETWDTPSEPAPWGVAGWTPGDRSLLVYARYDVWELDPAGRRAPRVVTDSAGVRAMTQLRVVDVDRDDRYIDPTRPLLLRAFDERTKASGFWRDRMDGTGAPERIVMTDARFGTPIKARDADVYAVTRETFGEFGDVWTGESLDRLTKATDGNPQQREYAWGSSELVRWRSDDGLVLDGILYKPAGFDPSKKYPMVVYFYEQLSENLHQYHQPFGRNVINPTVYTSQGYLVFFPDIAYTTGFPGQSALKSIVPGVQWLVSRGFVDEKAIGIGGQSWGGYQTAYIVTQTPLFRAAFAGAPVANMTSAYGGIRWESGVARAFQYEKGQSRIGRSIWDAPMRYLENSPLFYVDRVETPLLIMSNDADGAVPWYQGIELFVGLRRFGKEAYLVNYNGDGHNPRKRANQLDVDRRMQQFFAHHLKGEPAPDWMREGIPFLRKGRDQLQPVSPQPVAAQPAPGAATGTGSGSGEVRP